MAHLANCGSSEWGPVEAANPEGFEIRLCRPPVTATGTICHRDVGEQYPLVEIRCRNPFSRTSDTVREL
jgi:hypothetical protein